MPPLTHIFAKLHRGYCVNLVLATRMAEIKEKNEMLCPKSIADLCRSRVALKWGSSFSNIVLTNLPGRVIYVHTKKKGGMYNDYRN